MSYPLKAAQTVRALARAEAEQELARALELLAQAEERTAEAAAALRDARREEAKREARRAPPANGAALHRELQFSAARELRCQELVAAVERAIRSERRGAERLEEARRALAAASVEERVVEKHHERWSAAAAKVEERAEDERLDEISQQRWRR